MQTLRGVAVGVRTPRRTARCSETLERLSLGAATGLRHLGRALAYASNASNWHTAKPSAASKCIGDRADYVRELCVLMSEFNDAHRIKAQRLRILGHVRSILCKIDTLSAPTRPAADPADQSVPGKLDRGDDHISTVDDLERPPSPQSR